jgi:hypothetical protein
MNDLEPADERRLPILIDRASAFIARTPAPPRSPGPDIVNFHSFELRAILDLYGRKVAEGEWRDYAIDFSPQKAVFSIYRRFSECALYRIEKTPKLARKQGLYALVAASGLTLKRGQDLRRVLAVLDKTLKLVSG